MNKELQAWMVFSENWTKSARDQQAKESNEGLPLYVLMFILLLVLLGILYY